MVYSKAPTAYYTTLHDSITSLCKTILPLKKPRCLVSAEHKLWQLRSDNLKWQQDSLHQMLNLTALYRDDILSEAEVSAFRTHLLDTLLSGIPPRLDHALIIKDKLVFLQELLNAKCISEGEYHSSRRPLLVRLAVQGGEIEGRDVIISGSKLSEEEEWSEIDLKDEKCMVNKENSNSKKKSSKQAFKGAAASVFGFGSSYKPSKNSMERSIFDSPSLQMHSSGQSKVPSPPSINTQSELRHSKRKPFRALFHRDKNNNKEGHDGVEAVEKSGKKGLRKWKKSDTDDDTLPLSVNAGSDSEAYLPSYQLSSYGEVSMKNKLHSEEQVLVDNIKELSLSGTPTEMRSTNNFLSDQKQAYSTKLQEEYKAELKNDFTKPLDVVVKKQLIVSVGEMENMHIDAEEKHENSLGWTTFEDEENLHPNLFVHHDNKSLRSSSINPFSYGGYV